MIRNRNISTFSAARSVATRDQYSVKILRDSAQAFAATQTFNTGAALEVNLNGALCANPSSSATGQATLLLPSDLWFTPGGSIAVSGLVEGYDHHGNFRSISFVKSASAAVFTLSSSTVTIASGGSGFVTWATITRISLTNLTSNSTIAIGTAYSTASDDLMPKIALPVPVDSVDDLTSQLVVLGAGGATFTTPAAVPGRATISSVKGTNVALATIVITVAPTSEMEFIVGYRPGFVQSR